MTLVTGRVLRTWTAGRRADHVWDPGRGVAVLAVLCAALVQGAVAWSSRHPVLALDEVVMLGESRLLAGVAPSWQLEGAGFAPGLAALLAPAWWISHEPQAVFRFGIMLTVGLSLVAIWPLARLLTRFGATAPGGVIIASVVTVAPARALLQNYLVAESLLLLATVTTMLCAVRLAERPCWPRAFVLMLAVAAVVLAHGRGVALAAAVSVWALTMAARRPLLFVATAVGSGGAAGFALLAYRAVASAVLVSDARLDSSLASARSSSLADMGAGLIGQFWYASLAWPAVAFAGGAWAASRLMRSAAARLLVLSLAASVAIGLAQLSPDADSMRADVWFYGRYNDHMWTILAAIGLALLVRVRHMLFSAAVLAGTASVGVLMVLVTAPRIPASVGWVDMHVMGVSPWLSLEAFVEGEPQQWLMLSFLAAFLCLVVLALSWFRALVVPVLLLGWSALSVAHDVIAIDVRDGRPVAQYYGYGLEHLPAEAVLALPRGVGANGNMVVFAAGDLPVGRVDLSDIPDGVDVVFASFVEPPLLVDLGARTLTDNGGTVVVPWVLPGALFDELDAAGLLRAD